MLSPLCSWLAQPSFLRSQLTKNHDHKVAQADKAKTVEDWTALHDDFSRIAAKDKQEWLPQYYAALADLQKGEIMMQKGITAEINAIADEADEHIALAEALSPENSEIFVLKKMSHRLRMLVNPMERFRTEGALAEQALQKAAALDVNNPRIYLLMAEDAYFTPERFGGSKAKALELFQKAKVLYEKYPSKSPLLPHWGQEEAEYFLNKKS